MFRDFYATMAQVLPVLLLALVWDSNYLQRLRKQPRALRRDDPVGGVLFWTKPRVRVYPFVITGLLVVGIGVSLLVLALWTALTGRRLQDVYGCAGGRAPAFADQLGARRGR